MSMHQVILPEGWPRPKGYANGVAAFGRQVYIAGQIGWDEHEQFHSDDFGAQFRQVLKNTLAVLKAAGAGPEHIVRMTWYVTSRDEYNASLKDMGAAWRELMGRVYPAMAVVIVAGLIEPRAKIEIETTAVVPEAL